MSSESVEKMRSVLAYLYGKCMELRQNLEAALTATEQLRQEMELAAGRRQQLQEEIEYLTAEYNRLEAEMDDSDSDDSDGAQSPRQRKLTLLRQISAKCHEMQTVDTYIEECRKKQEEYRQYLYMLYQYGADLQRKSEMLENELREKYREYEAGQTALLRAAGNRFGSSAGAQAARIGYTRQEIEELSAKCCCLQQELRSLESMFDGPNDMDGPHKVKVLRKR